MENNFIQIFKTAAALSIIKSKPNELPTRQYAENICSDYGKSQLFWKKKYEKVKDEILTLRQQSIIDKNVSNQEYEQLHSDPRDPELSNAELFPTPPLSYEEKPTSKSIFFQKNTIYLQSIINLKNLLKSVHNEPIQATTKETVLTNLQILKDILIKEDTNISLYNMTESMKCIIELSGMFHGNDYREINGSLVNMVEGFVSKLFTIDGSDEGSLRSRDNLQALILTFLDINNLSCWAATVKVLMTQCVEFCDNLRDAQAEYQALCCKDYENTFYIIDCITRGLKANHAYLSSCEGKNICASIQLDIDKSLLHISNKFPLVTQSLWKISGILQSFLQESV